MKDQTESSTMKSKRQCVIPSKETPHQNGDCSLQDMGNLGLPGPATDSGQPEHTATSFLLEIARGQGLVPNTELF